MKFRTGSVLALALVTAVFAGGSLLSTSSPAVAAPAGAGFSVDPMHSSVVFRVKHFNASFFYGRFNNPTGSFDLNFEKPEASSIEVSVKTEDIDTNNDGRNKHLKSEEFFSAKEYPTISFKGKTFKKTGDHTMEVAGELTMRGQTKPVTAVIEHTGEGKGQGGVSLSGVETRLVIKRSDWGVSGLVGPLGDEVTLYIALEGKK